MTRKSRKLQSSFCEVDYVFRLPVLHRAVVLVFRRTISWYAGGRWSRDSFLGNFLSLGCRSVSETLLVSLFRTVYLFKNLESLNTVSDLKEIERHIVPCRKTCLISRSKGSLNMHSFFNSCSGFNQKSVIKSSTTSDILRCLNVRI